MPSNYSNARFKSRQLDYAFAEESVAVEVWGWSQNVARALAAHNEVVRRVASRHEDVVFIDMERVIPKDGNHFIDVCHWTDLGRATFAREVEAVLSELLDSHSR